VQSFNNPLPGLSQLRIAVSVLIEMVNPHDNPAALKELQDAIYRDRILRAREMSSEARFESGIEQTNSAMTRILEGAMWQTGIADVREGWAEVRRRMQRISQVRDQGFYVTSPPL
jgi:hypothetical protein